MLGFFKQQLLERKYANMERETALRAQEIASQNQLRTQQAAQLKAQSMYLPEQMQAGIGFDIARTNNLNTETGLLGARASVENAYTTARTNNLNTETSFLPQRYAVEMEEGKARAGLNRSNSTLLGTQNRQLGMRASTAFKPQLGLDERQRNIFGQLGVRFD